MTKIMKRISLITLLCILLGSCGVGSYSITTGEPDQANLSFVADKKYDVVVTIDNDKQYELETVKLKAYRNDRSIKRTVENTIILSPGTHEVEVEKDGVVISAQKIFVSTGENRVIEL